MTPVPAPTARIVAPAGLDLVRRRDAEGEVEQVDRRAGRAAGRRVAVGRVAVGDEDDDVDARAGGELHARVPVRGIAGRVVDAVDLRVGGRGAAGVLEIEERRLVGRGVGGEAVDLQARRRAVQRRDELLGGRLVRVLL